MAQIPTYKSQSGLRAGTGNTQLSVPGGLQEAAAAPANALAELGKTGMDMSVKFFAQQKAIERENLLAANYEKFLIGDDNNQGFNLIKADAMSKGDTAALENFKMLSENYYNQILSTIDDDVVKRAFQEKYNDTFASNFIDVQSQVYQNNIDKGKETLAQNINNSTNRFVNGFNQSEKNKGFSEIELEIDKAIELGIVDPGSKDKILYAAHEVAYKTDLKQQINTNPQAVIDKIEGGLYNDLINAEDLSTIKNSALSAVSKNNTEYITNLTTNGDIKKEKLEGYIESIELFEAPDMERVNALVTELASIDQARVAVGKTPKYTDTIEDYKDAVFAFNYLEGIKNNPSLADEIVAQIEKEISDDRALGNDPNNSLIKARDKAIVLRDKINTDSITDNNVLQQELGNPGLPDVDFFSDPITFQTQIKGDGAGSYKEIITNNANRMNIGVQYFTDNSFNKIEEKLKTANYDDFVNFFTNISNVAGKDTIDVFNQFKDLDPGLAHVGMLINLNDGKMTKETQSAIKGYISGRDQNNKDVFSKMPDDWKIEINNEFFNSAYDEKQMLGLKDQILQAGNYIFLDKLKESDYFNEMAESVFTKASFDLDGDDKFTNLYKDSLQEAAGRIQKNGVYYGGFVEHGPNNFIIIPDNIRNDFDILDGLEEGLTDELYNMATFVIRPRVPMPGNLETESTEFAADFTETPQGHFDGQPIDDWKDFFFEKESIYFSNYEEANGVYYIHFNNPNEPGSKIYTDKEGRPILFDLGGIYDELLKNLEDPKVEIDFNE